MPYRTDQAIARLSRMIRDHRERQGKSQLCLAAELGYTSGQTISNYERGLRVPRGKTLLRLADALRADPAQFIDVYRQITISAGEREIERAFGETARRDEPGQEESR